MIELILNPKKQKLRLSCGQCGDPKDLIFEVKENGDLSIVMGEADDPDNTEECPLELMYEAAHVVL